MFGRTVFSNPDISAVTEYAPVEPRGTNTIRCVGGRPEREPLLLVSEDDVGMGNTAPLESVSTPVTVPKYPWPNNRAGNISEIAITRVAANIGRRWCRDVEVDVVILPPLATDRYDRRGTSPSSSREY